MVRGAQPDDAVGWMHEPQEVARDLLDEVLMRRLGAQQRDISSELGPHGFEALDLELDEAGALDELRASLEAVAALMGVEAEVAG